MGKKKLIIVAKDETANHCTDLLVGKTFNDSEAITCKSTAEAIAQLNKGSIDLVVYIVDFLTPKHEECLIVKELSAQDKLVPVFFFYKNWQT